MAGLTLRKPRILDLFCKAGGAGMGYARAGFDVVGVDIAPQPNYPFQFWQYDALAVLPAYIEQEYDAVHASPPCQAHSALRTAPGGKAHLDLIPQTRALLQATGLPWVIENVEGAPLEAPAVLCGSSFGLGSQGCELRRHRLFETNWPLTAPACAHSDLPVIGVYGGHARRRAASAGGRGTKDVWRDGHRAAASEALGIDWMTLAELSEAIPPAYTYWIGQQLRHEVVGRRV